MDTRSPALAPGAHGFFMRTSGITTLFGRAAGLRADERAGA